MKEVNCYWLQCIKSILYKNGLGDIYDQPMQTNCQEAKCKVLKRLEDQFIQVWYRKESSKPFGSRLCVLKDLFKMSEYLIEVKNHEIRNIFTRLRCGYNILHSSIGRFRNGGNKNCSLCNCTVESVEHFLFSCPYFDDIRQDQLNYIKENVPNFDVMDSEGKLSLILDFDVQRNKKEVLRSYICKFVCTMYNARKHVNEMCG